MNSQLIIGDCHVDSFAMKEQEIINLDKITLQSVLQSTVQQFLIENIEDELLDIDEIDLCLGSIDIRFLVFAKNPPKPSRESLAHDYAKQVIKAQKKLGIKINVCLPAPTAHCHHNISTDEKVNNVCCLAIYPIWWAYTIGFIKTLHEYESEIDFVNPPSDWYYCKTDPIRDLFGYGKITLNQKYSRSNYNWPTKGFFHGTR